MSLDFQKQMDTYFSKVGENVKDKTFEPLGLSNEEVSTLLSTKEGLSDALTRNFPELCFRDKAHTKPKAFMQALFVWEVYGRKATISELAEALQVKVTSIPQYMYVVRDAVNAALGLDIVCEGDTYKLMSMDDLRQRSEHLLKAMESFGARYTKLQRAVESLEKLGYSEHPQLAAAKTATDGVTSAMKALTGQPA